MGLALVLSLFFAALVAGTGAMISAIVLSRVRPAAPPEIAQSPAPAVPSSLPPSAPAARLARQVDCVWSGAADAPQVGDNLEAGRRLVLKSGLAELIFHDGARALLEGPATFVVLSPASAVLNVGKCTVTAESPLARGFVIDAPGMKYTDLGTEFGVLVAHSGEQEVHVFRGMVRAEQGAEQGAGSREAVNSLPSPSGRGAGGEGGLPSSRQPLILTANQAIRVAAPGNSGEASKPIQRIAADARQFVRELPTPLDLADIVAGGDGTTGKTGRGLDPLTGSIVDAKEGLRVRTGRGYHRVSAIKFVDSVFVPDGRSGPVQLDSAGHSYALPKTGGRTDHSIFAESIGPLAAKQRGMPLARSELADNLAQRMTRSHPLIYLHANVGISFDLDAIRASRPGNHPARFQAVLSTERSDRPAAVMSAWVFVDGTLCYQKQKFSLRDGYFGIDVPLSRAAHFLTLVATDADLDLNSDHVILHCPQLVMETGDNG